MSNEPQHTPGPWTYRKASKHFHIEASAPGYGTAVAEVHYVGNADTGWTSEANARLIAAAPEMLAALVYTLDQAGIDPASPCHKVIVAAIAKAKENEPC